MLTKPVLNEPVVNETVLTAKVLILSDQQLSAEIWSHAIMRYGIAVDVADLSAVEQHIASMHEYDLGILDINEQEADGVAICRSIRGVFDGPLLVLTYEQDERIHLGLYREGADECVIKPIGPILLIAKMMAWLRRSAHAYAVSSDFEYNDFRLEPDLRRLTTPSGDVIKLSKLESRLVFLLLTNRGQVVPSESIVAQVWRGYGDGDSGLLKRLVYRVRRKIEPEPKCPRYIEGVPGSGYRFRPE